MSSLSARIFEARKKLSDTDEALVKQLLDDPKGNSQLSLAELSEKLYVSKSAIFRLCKKLGLSGYSELKFELMRTFDETEVESTIDIVDKTAGILKGVIQQYKHYNCEPFFRGLEKAGTVYLYSTGWQQELIANYIAKELFLVGKNTTVLPSAFDELRRCSGWAKKDDMLIIVTFSGNRERLYEELNKIRLTNNRLNIVSLTRPGANKITSISDFSLFFDTIDFSTYKGFSNEKISFSPAYVYVDLLINEYYLWHNNQKEQNNGEA